ncbi:MAG TPA: hypothetical protein VED17_08310 [Nitrososphaerales archaeon]|nr:hypothetical protein [Nitrososphaerales archaeon]
MCKSFASINCRDPFEIKTVLDSHQWMSMSSDRTPVGMISRFTCSKCGDEYVVMLTSPSAMRAEENVHKTLEVSADNVIF